MTWRFYVVSIGIFLVAVTSVVVIAYLANNIVTASTNQARLNRINAIYASINVGDSYTPTNTNVFGDKRVYSWDKSRTYSSEIDYVHADTVSNTVADLDAKIKAAGFTFFEEPYPGGAFVEYHYKSAKGEYVRLNVSSKPYNDALSNAAMMSKDIPASAFAMDKNAGPSKVILKVNLDDNNE